MTVNFLDLIHIEISVPNKEEAYQAGNNKKIKKNDRIYLLYLKKQ